MKGDERSSQSVESAKEMSADLDSPLYGMRLAFLSFQACNYQINVIVLTCSSKWHYT